MKLRKLKKKHWLMIYSGGIVFVLTVFLIYLDMNGLDPEDYKDSSELYKLVKDLQRGKLLSYYNYDSDKLYKDPRYWDVCLKIVEDEPSYFEFIKKELSFSDLKTPLKIPERWKDYSKFKILIHSTYIKELLCLKYDMDVMYPILIKCLNSEWKQHRLNAIDCLGELGGQRALEALLAVLKDEEEVVRNRVIQSLGYSGEKGAVEPLIELLGDKDPDTRISVIVALRRLGDERAIKPLEERLEIEEDSIKDNIEKALKALNATKANAE